MRISEDNMERFRESSTMIATIFVLAFGTGVLLTAGLTISLLTTP